MGERKSAAEIVVLCPLRVEHTAVARALRRAGLGEDVVEVRCTGPGGAAVGRAVAALPRERVRCVLLAGVAGGLAEVGERVPAIGRVVDVAGGSWRCSVGGGGCTIIGVDEVAHGVEEKRALRERTGAELVDTESHAFAAACAARGWRWGVVRGVSDRWDEALPREVGGWVDARGRTRIGRVAADVLRRPRLIGDLVRLGRRSGDAMRAVGERVVEVIKSQMAKDQRASVGEGGELGALVGGERGAGTVILFGGTFDPPHRGHVELPERVRRAVEGRMGGAGGAAWLVYVPAARSPFKDVGPVASDEDRLEMLRRAVAGNPRAVVWDVEIERARREGEGPSYTVETVERARRELGDDVTLRLLIGADQAAEFHRWRRPREIISMAEPLVMLRSPEESVEGLMARMRASGAWSEEELAAWAGRVVEVGTMDVSATRVREELMKQGRDRERLREMVGDAVSLDRKSVV